MRPSEVNLAQLAGEVALLRDEIAQLSAAFSSQQHDQALNPTGNHNIPPEWPFKVRNVLQALQPGSRAFVGALEQVKALSWLIRHGHEDHVQRVCQLLRVPKHYVLFRNSHLLSKAAQYGRLTILQFFCLHFSLNEKDKTADTLDSKNNCYSAKAWYRAPMLQAVSNGHLDIVHYMFESFPYVKTETSDYYFGLFDSYPDVLVQKAAENSHLEVLSFLISSLIPTAENEINWYNLLTNAVKGGSMPVVNFILKQGMVHYPTAGALYICSERGRLDMLQCLLEQLGVTTLKNEITNTVVSRAARYGHLHILQFLDNKFTLSVDNARANNNEALRDCAAAGHVEVLKYLHERFGLNRNDARAKHNEALRVAAENGHLDTVQYLHTAFRLAPRDVRDKKCWAVRCAKTVQVAAYLYEEMGLTHTDASGILKYYGPCTKYGRIANEEIKEYLRQKLATPAEIQSDPCCIVS